MSERRNPTTSRVAGPIPGLGDTTLPIPSGVNMEAQKDSERMPEVNMSKNDGDQRDVASPAFAVGKDERHFEGGPSGADATPAMPGA
jgi:hypothetical protein